MHADRQTNTPPPPYAFILCTHEIKMRPEHKKLDLKIICCCCGSIYYIHKKF
jgi:hypothetical protein